MEIDEYNGVILNLTGNLERYRDLDKFIYINPLEKPITDKTKLIEFFEICPKAMIADNIDIGRSTIEEYINGELWIESIIQKINPNWTDIQKVAFIDNEIGKKISYSPDFDTEVFDNSRALWKIINSGYGICNGIAQVEYYILKRIGIEAELVGSYCHGFLKLNNIELPNEKGEYVKGSTILDPTWNLAAQRYEGMPNNFCKSYEKIRKRDINKYGEDTLAHKNDEELSDATLNLDEQNLRQIYASIGIADKNGEFPIQRLKEMSKILYYLDLPEEDNIKNQFLLLHKYYPEFATCINSTMKVLTDIILNNEKLHFNDCVVHRVYERQDKKKNAILYVYIDLPKAGKKFYYADKEEKQFIELSQKQFEEKFECYEMDMKQNMEEYNCERPWEVSTKEENKKQINKTSEELVAKKGVDR